MKAYISAFIIIIVSICSTAGARPVGITAKAGTLGLGADLTVGLVASRLNARAGINGFTYAREFEMEDADVEAELDWMTIPILLDWHPAGGGFRISSGPVINNNEISLSADPNVPIELEDKEYDIAGLDGAIAFDDASFYFGIGYGNAAASEGRWHFACDFGVMYHGEPDATASATAQNAAVQTELNNALAEEVEQFEEDARAFQFYPVVSMGVSFAFN